MNPKFEALVLEIILSEYEILQLYFAYVTNDAPACTNPIC